MSGCNIRHPDQPDLACVLPRNDRGHAVHIGQRYTPGQSEPMHILWHDPAYRTREQARAEHRRVGAVVETKAAELRQLMRESNPAVPLPIKPGQRKKTRLGQVANMLANNVGVWISGHRLATAEIGGSEGLKRLRELRDDYHWPIVNRPVPNSTDEYMLVELPEGIT